MSAVLSVVLLCFWTTLSSFFIVTAFVITQHCFTGTFVKTQIGCCSHSGGLVQPPSLPRPQPPRSSPPVNALNFCIFFFFCSLILLHSKWLFLGGGSVCNCEPWRPDCLPSKGMCHKVFRPLTAEQDNASFLKARSFRLLRKDSLEGEKKNSCFSSVPLILLDSLF